MIEFLETVERLNRLKVLLEEEKCGKDVEKEIADVVKHLRRIDITKAINDAVCGRTDGDFLE